mmetsp:Transcript_8097/g.19253  ORF Transcript_8097/g.19253 Transcript_8097/m.19253 type:complete len:466 (-) Transcript_8097:28-1425(-)
MGANDHGAGSVQYAGAPDVEGGASPEQVRELRGGEPPHLGDGDAGDAAHKALIIPAQGRKRPSNVRHGLGSESFRSSADHITGALHQLPVDVPRARARPDDVGQLRWLARAQHGDGNLAHGLQEGGIQEPHRSQGPGDVREVLGVEALDAGHCGSAHLGQQLHIAPLQHSAGPDDVGQGLGGVLGGVLAGGLSQGDHELGVLLDIHTQHPGGPQHVGDPLHGDIPDPLVGEADELPPGGGASDLLHVQLALLRPPGHTVHRRGQIHRVHLVPAARHQGQHLLRAVAGADRLVQPPAGVRGGRGPGALGGCGLGRRLLPGGTGLAQPGYSRNLIGIMLDQGGLLHHFGGDGCLGPAVMNKVVPGHQGHNQHTVSEHTVISGFERAQIPGLNSHLHIRASGSHRGLGGSPSHHHRYRRGEGAHSDCEELRGHEEQERALVDGVPAGYKATVSGMNRAPVRCCCQYEL